MSKSNYLLTDEAELCEQDYYEREKLIKEFKEMPEEFWLKVNSWGVDNKKLSTSHFLWANLSCNDNTYKI